MKLIYNNYIQFKKSLKDKYQFANIVLKLYRFDNYSLYLHKISLPEEYKSKGIGSEIMNLICNFADENSLNIKLTPTDTFGSDLDLLIKFYSKFGFVFDNKEEMKRCFKVVS